MEIWKTIKDYEDIYEVSNLGNVKSLKFGKEKILKPSKDGGGYLQVVLTKTKNKKSKTIKIHKLVSLAFLKNICNGRILVVNHINFTRTDNRVENLEVVTMRENNNKKHIKSSSIYTGVCWDIDYKKWRAKIYINKKQVFLGLFDLEIDASNAYQNKLLTLNKNYE